MLRSRKLRMQLSRLRPAKGHLAVFAASVLIVLCAEWFYQFFFFHDISWPIAKADANVALIADPQLVDQNSYPSRSPWLLALSIFATDRYLARNFRLMDSVLKPSAYFFLGDLFDGGREWESENWFRELERWQRIFPDSQHVERVTALPGNHDVGSASGIRRDAFTRFQTHFGESTNVMQLANHKIVLLDTNTLMDTKDQTIRGPVASFFDDIKADYHKLDPLILLTHVPLFRRDGSPCGPHREHGSLTLTHGYQYVTMVDAALSAEILNKLKPKLVFSGDDHDVCEYVHETDRDILETTVKSFSMAGGIARPGFQLLSLREDGTHETAPVLLPHPFVPFYLLGIFYGILLIFCIGSSMSSGPVDYYALPITYSDNSKDQKHTKGALAQLRDSVLWGVLGFIVGELIIERWCYSAMY